jgi:hypothetical protein
VLNGLKYLGKFAQAATAIRLPGLVPVNLASVRQTKKITPAVSLPALLKNHGPVALFHRTMG